MSRVGKNPIALDGAQISIADGKIVVKGADGINRIARRPNNIPNANRKDKIFLFKDFFVP